MMIIIKFISFPIWGFGLQILLHFFQGNCSHVSPHMVCCSSRPKFGYSKALESRSHYALRFSVTQQSEAKSIRYRTMTCVNATDNVSVSLSFKICGLERLTPSWIMISNFYFVLEKGQHLVLNLILENKWFRNCLLIVESFIIWIVDCYISMLRIIFIALSRKRNILGNA